MDPYEVLGITKYATDDEVKRAYHELSRKYHPDANAGNPLADLAEEKFKEVQSAYDMIMDMRKTGQDQGYYQEQGPYGQNGQGPYGQGPYGQGPYGQGSYQNSQGYYDDRGQYQQYGSAYSRTPANRGGSCMNDICTLILCDSLCECMGGDLCKCI